MYAKFLISVGRCWRISYWRGYRIGKTLLFRYDWAYANYDEIWDCFIANTYSINMFKLEFANGVYK